MTEKKLAPRHMLHKQDELPDAEQGIDQAIKLFEQREYAAAEKLCWVVLKRTPGHADAMAFLGLLQSDPTIRSAPNQTDIPFPVMADGLVNLGMRAIEKGALWFAEKALRCALQFNERHPVAWHELGRVHHKSGRREEARAAYLKALELRPNYFAALGNLGALLVDLQDFTMAETCLQQALTLNNDSSVVHFSCTRLYMLTGRFDQGWWHNEKCRCATNFHQKFSLLRPVTQKPMWNGEPLTGKTLLLCDEQGFGDKIQFCRYAKLVKEAGGRTLLRVDYPLATLMRTLPWVDRVVTFDAMPDDIEFDYWSFMFSMPYHFGTTLKNIPLSIPYLFADPAKATYWRNRLDPHAGKRLIGLCWAGRPTHSNDQNRSLTLAALAPLASLPECVFVSLQKGASAMEAKNPPHGMTLLDLGKELPDFSDTAALLQCLDLLITVDSAPAHLAGAMGLPAWVMIPANPDWRWLLEREDCVWYPTLRLFRQSHLGNWSDTIERLTDALITGQTANPSSPPAKSKTDESARRKQAITAGQTDLERWANPAQLEDAWEGRSIKAAEYVLAGSRVLDIGCGKMMLEKHLPAGCVYQPCDVVARDARTVVLDLNHEQLPIQLLHDADIVTMLGVWEYLYEPELLLRALAQSGKPLLCSYCPSELTRHLDRQTLGWVNDFSVDQFLALAKAVGYCVRQQEQVDGIQHLFKLGPCPDPDQLSLPKRRAHVIAYNNVGNFGDRLGYHLVNELLPADVEVTWGTLRPFTPVPDGTDLLLLGIGNSLFGELLTDELVAAVVSTPLSVGIFGTQYRSLWDAKRLHPLLDRLTHWYARYEEDVLLYGRGRDNVTHLGDWLINAFPLTRAQNAQRLVVGREILKELPLDRTIQKIQQHREVYSERLHPLLCALTSAERVAYREQRETGDASVHSGKFRSMLMDVFGRNFPEEVLWEVDRDAVCTYKVKVAQRTMKMKEHFARLLAVMQY
ncbi:MAG: hypothetical protein A2521_06305 [Deltaproteobacteria bacterium RIFOXYD12_FULL_57_12]|nr:MAG: hypothetical protein A2521_06305 [Deltaproteobacteria bacterium RIFOXYD12_FULL_57_12]